MKTLDEVIDALSFCCDMTVSDCGSCPFYKPPDCAVQNDALHYLKEYKKQKYIWKKLYLLAHQMFWGLEEEYPLDGKRIANDLCDYSGGFDDEDA